MTESIDFRCGFVALVGRPNVGKSTLLNQLLGQKISITSSKPQTTRHRIRGIDTAETSQAIYVDTPGLHRTAPRALNRYMNRAASSAISEVDIIVLVVDRTRWTEEDQWILERVRTAGRPTILVVNKVDELPDKSVLLPHLQVLSEKMDFAAVIPLSARTGDNVAVLAEEVRRHLPVSPPYFPADQITDRSERFLAAELIREKLMRNLGAEIPYAVTVEIDEFALRDNIAHVIATIWVERDGQKAIVIGKDGARLKSIGQAARQDMERAFGNKVFLRLWVKVKEDWASDERALRSLGYSDEF